MNEVAIFDLDGVIIDGQSQQIFLKYLFRKKLIGLFFYIKTNLWFIFYKLGMLRDPKKIMQFAFSFFEEKDAGEVEKITDDFFNENLKRFIFPEIIDIINENRQKGREVVILSNAVDIVVDKVAHFLGVNKYISTRLEIKGGKFTGKITGDIVYGKNKTHLISAFLGDNNLDINKSFVFADHISDLDLLLSVSNPCAVNPDKFLFHEARLRNWPILRFKK